jgi:hypothetical protein
VVLTSDGLQPVGLDQSHVIKNYSSDGAETGQTFAQFPQLMQAELSTTYWLSPSLIAQTGHSAAHAPQLIQASDILYAIKFTPLTTLPNILTLLA